MNIRHIRRTCFVAALILIAAACSGGNGPATSESTPGEAAPRTEATPEPEAPEGGDEMGGEHADERGGGGEHAYGRGDGETTADRSAPEPALDPPGPLVVSFIITDVSMISAALGWEVPDQGDLEAAIEALTTHVNDHGSVAGRSIDARIHVFNAITDDPITEGELCTAITQDDRADFVVLTGQFQENARPCYADARTTMLDVTLFPVDRAGYEELAPHLWSPLFPSYETLIGGLAEAVAAEGWLSGATIGVLGVDTKMNRRIYETVLVERLAAHGEQVESVNWVDQSTSTAIENSLSQAILNFKAAGVDKVIVLGGSRMASYMMDIASTQNYTPAYALSSYDSPEFNIRNYPELLVGSLGISVLPGWDIAEDQYPSPANEAEATCLEILGDAGLTYESRANSRTALLYCDVVRLLEHAGKLAATPRAEDIRSALHSVGSGFTSASVYLVELAEGSYAGGAGYRVFSFDETCSCMVAGSETIRFPD